ncbi:flagellin N-terminal helical domain-containing protein [Anaeromyxobacter diazotrophicus]|uniref:Flagellin n=1 Tax=Anaeromyxobacter diazotrophicus TaxID=2590199 RepID=A0A7I9VRW6_9BACT|nr:flagellin [Anaeromyxobacter diazotrophicus]GEJ59173.1 flagellin [Anaeromyxobacter diazotrophicus]
MSLSIRTNVASLDAQRNLSQTQLSLDSSLSKLSSGYRITKAGDDAAGLGISTSLDAQYKSYNQAVRNANDGLSVGQTAEAGFNEISNILTRMRELAMQASSDGVTDSQRSSMIDTERSQLSSEVDRIANSTKFNGVALLSGSATTLDFHVGIGSSGTNDVIGVSSVDVTASGLSIGSLDLSTKAGAVSALDTIDSALDTLSTKRATFGAVGNRLQSAINAVQTFAQATAAANSRIRDVDVAQETANMTRANILAQAGVSVLAQANQMPQMALKLLG